MLVEFLNARAWKHTEQRTPRIQPPGTEALVASGNGVGPIKQRVPDVLGVGPVTGQEFGLERQDGRHAVRRCSERARPTTLPGPDLGRDVIQHSASAHVGRPRNPQIESRIIHQNHQVGTLDLNQPNHLSFQAPEIWEARQDFDESHDGERVEFGQEFHPLGLEPIPTHPDEPGFRGARSQRANQGRCMLVPRGLTREDKDGRLRVGQKAQPRYQITRITRKR